MKREEDFVLVAATYRERKTWLDDIDFSSIQMTPKETKAEQEKAEAEKKAAEEQRQADEAFKKEHDRLEELAAQQRQARGQREHS